MRLTLQQLADRMETDPRNLRRIERGQTNLSADSLLRLAAALEVQLVHLWVDELPPVPTPREPPARRPRRPQKGPPRTPSAVLAERVISLRDRDGLTQQQLATRSGVSVSLVRGIENGRNSPTLRSLEHLARVRPPDRARVRPPCEEAPWQA